MRLKRSVLFGSILFLAAGPVPAQDSSLQDMLPGLREQAVVLEIITRIVEPNKEVWNSSSSKVTIPGRPVGIKLVGENIVVAVQFTPYLRAGGRNVLVAQGQIWVDVPNVGIRYQTTMHTIPLEYGEQIYFFPLGQVRSGDTAHMEIQLAIHPYLTESAPETPVPDTKIP